MSHIKPSNPVEDILCLSPESMDNPIESMINVLSSKQNQDALWFVARKYYADRTVNYLRPKEANNDHLRNWLAYLVRNTERRPIAMHAIHKMVDSTGVASREWIEYTVNMFLGRTGFNQLFSKQVQKLYKLAKRGIEVKLPACDENTPISHVKTLFYAYLANNMSCMEILGMDGMASHIRKEPAISNILMRHMLPDDIRTIVLSKHYAAVHDVFRKIPTFNKMWMKILIASIVVLRKFVRNIRLPQIGECMICYEDTKRIIPLHGDIRHSACAECRNMILSKHSPTCPMCRVYLSHNKRQSTYMLDYDGYDEYDEDTDEELRNYYDDSFNSHRRQFDDDEYEYGEIYNDRD